MKKIFATFLAFLNIAHSVYDKYAATTWAQDCAFGCCTYFTTHALVHGGWGYGYQGVCATLWSNFKAGKYSGWTKAGVTESDIHKGDAVIMNNGHSGDASHCCIGTGHGLVSCHNPGHRDVPASSTWYSGGYINAVYTYSGVTSVNSTISETEDVFETFSETIINCSPFESDACNCVYYARDRQPKLPTGLTTCADKKSKVNSNTPVSGCVLFRTGDPTYCHAAYVTKVANGMVYYDQSNWSPCKCSSDSLSLTSSAILGYWCP